MTQDSIIALDTESDMVRKAKSVTIERIVSLVNALLLQRKNKVLIT